jgi:Clp amino terminal domain, pathogenicity island component
MLERFTDRARRAVKLAEEEARRLDHDWIGTGHILLGLIREGDGVAAQVLVKLGADLNRVRQQVIQLIAAQPQPGHLLSRPRRCVTGRRNCWPARPHGRSSGPPRIRRCRFWPNDASSSPARSSGSGPCSASTASTRKTSQPDLRPSTASQPGSGPRNLHLDRTHWLEVPGVAGSLGDGRSACLTPSCPRPAPAAAVRTRAAGSRFRYDRSLPSQAIRARGSIAAKDMA